MKLLPRFITALGFCVALTPSLICETAVIPLGLATRGAIRSSAQTNEYFFAANAGDVVNLTIAVTNGKVEPEIRVLTSDGKLVASKSSANASGSLELNEITLPSSADGTYVVEVSDHESANTGAYSVFVQKSKNPDNAMGILWGEAQLSEINTAAYRDTYTFTGTAHDVIDFNLASISGSLGPKIRVYGPDGALLKAANSLSCGGSQLQLNRVNLPTSGSYTVLVGDCSGRNTGSYDLTTRCSGVCLLPSPTLSFVSPASRPAGGQGFTLTVNGANFVQSNARSVVAWNGSELPTTFVSTNQLKVHIPASFVEKAGTFPITVLTAAAGAGSSEAISFPVHNPAPALATLTPSKTRAGATSSLILTVRGSNFVPGSIVQWNGLALATTFDRDNQLTATVPTSDLAAAGKATIAVFNSNPGGGASAAQSFNVENPQPGVSSIYPAGTTVGHAALTLTVNGSNFLPLSTIEWNGAGLPTTYVSASKLQAVVPSSSFSLAGSYSVTVLNPAPGGGLAENAQTFTVGPPAAAPYFHLAGGTYGTKQTLVLTDSAPDAVIYYTYTANGSIPTTASTAYHGPITVDTTGIVEAIAVAPGFSQSAISSKSYVITPTTQTAAPFFSLAGGEYYTPQMLSLTDATPGAIIYYTTNGSAPTTSSAVYAGPFAINTTEVVRAVAVAPGYSLSAQSSKAYQIDRDQVAAAPYFSLAGGTYSTTQTLVLTDSTPGATIYYTTDGVSPSSDDPADMASRQVYTGPITIDSTELVQAVAVANGYNLSPVSSKAYVVVQQP